VTLHLILNHVLVTLVITKFVLQIVSGIIMLVLQNPQLVMVELLILVKSVMLQFHQTYIVIIQVWIHLLRVY